MADDAETIRPAYPRRPRFFSHRFTRLIARVCLANDLGPEVCWLLTVIVNTEDAKGYRDAVTFFNDQLASVAGFGSDSSLDRFRRKAVDAGWLHYEPGGRRRAGRYWVTIPDRFEDVKDGPLDHDPGEYQNGEPSPSRAGVIRGESGSYPGDNRELSGEKAGVIREQCGDPSSLPLPLPHSQEPPTPPSGGVVPAVAEEFLGVWNTAAAETGWVPCRQLSGKRLRAFRSRCADGFWRENWRAALVRAGPIPGLRGQNDRNWRADVDWFLRPDTVVKIVEGKYDGWRPGSTGGQAGARTDYAKRTLGGIL